MSMLQHAIDYAKQRWCLDDPAIVTEWYERYPQTTKEEVETMVDEYADDYDLIDPRSY